MSVLIKGGRVITAADDYVADVFVDGRADLPDRRDRSTSRPTG